MSSVTQVQAQTELKQLLPWLCQSLCRPPAVPSFGNPLERIHKCDHSQVFKTQCSCLIVEQHPQVVQLSLIWVKSDGWNTTQHVSHKLPCVFIVHALLTCQPLLVFGIPGEKRRKLGYRMCLAEGSCTFALKYAVNLVTGGPCSTTAL